MTQAEQAAHKKTTGTGSAQGTSTCLIIALAVVVALASIIGYQVYVYLAAESVYLEPRCTSVTTTDKLTWLSQEQFESRYTMGYKNDGITRKRTYISMRRGRSSPADSSSDADVKIAATIYLPTRALNEGHKIPSILHGTRYNRAFKTRFPFNLFLGDEVSPRIEQYVQYTN